MIGIFAAINEEVSSLKSSMSISKTVIHQDCRLYEGRCDHKDFILVLTGVGKKRAQQAAEIALERYPLKAIISTGFSGALNHNTRAGDIVLHSRLCCGEDSGPLSHSNGALEPDSNLKLTLIETLESTGLRSMIGTGVSIDSICLTSKDKEGLGEKLQADSVDMESYWLAQEARKRKVPFITVRSIFDAMDDDLSCLSQMSQDGKIDQGAAARYVLMHPGQIKNLTVYARNARKAEKNISILLHKIVEAI